ncbi:MAG: hydantoinase B/oxoprolinase family protein, partial [Promethearchaeota archaeon]
NAVYSMTLSHTLCCSFVFLGTELSAYHNEGSLRPFHVITREGTILNSRPGALTAATPGRIGNLIFPCVLSVLSQALPQRAVATWGRGTCAFLPVGIDPRTNKTYVRSSFCAIGGAGAVYGYDGYQCCGLGDTLGAVSKADVEDEMVRFPWRVKTYEFLTDSCGAGKWRGAPGIWWEIVNEGGDCLAHGSGGGLHTQVQGQQGGHPTPFGKGYTLHGTERVDVEHGHVERHFKDRDIIVSLGGGGAGVGPPEERDPEAVRMDVKNELVSIEAARDIYKVVLVADSMEIDYDATQRLRGKN